MTQPYTPLTRAMIVALSSRAAESGDEETVDLCRDALRPPELRGPRAETLAKVAELVTAHLEATTGETVLAPHTAVRKAFIDLDELVDLLCDTDEIDVAAEMASLRRRCLRKLLVLT